MARLDGKDRGLFQRPGSATWWIRWTCASGHEHREKIGPKSLARQMYQQRKVAVKTEGWDEQPAVDLFAPGEGVGHIVMLASTAHGVDSQAWFWAQVLDKGTTLQRWMTRTGRKDMNLIALLACDLGVFWATYGWKFRYEPAVLMVEDKLRPGWQRGGETTKAHRKEKHATRNTQLRADAEQLRREHPHMSQHAIAARLGQRVTLSPKQVLRILSTR